MINQTQIMMKEMKLSIIQKNSSLIFVIIVTIITYVLTQVSIQKFTNHLLTVSQKLIEQQQMMLKT